jgi:ABC-type nitrate/sulfonate/bicarbonate transport system permease component
MNAPFRRRGTPRRRSARFFRDASVQLVTLAGAVALWESLTRHFAEPYFPPPSTIVKAVRSTWFSGPGSRLFLTQEATSGLTSSLGRLGLAWVGAAVLGVVAGLALGRSPRLAQYLDPLMHLGRAMPPPTLIPFFIAVLHLGASTEVAAIASGVIWPVMLNTIDGARSVEPLYIDTATVFGISRVRRLFAVILPAAAPKIFAGLRSSVALSVILMVMAELLGSGNGIGAQLVQAQRTFDLPGMWGDIIILGVLGYVLNVLLLAAERRCLRWHRDARRPDADQMPGG